MLTLKHFGWTEQIAAEWDLLEQLDHVPARVVADFGTSLKLAIPEVISAELSGKLAHHSSQDMVPKIGDWVAVKRYDNGDAVIDRVIFRRNEIARRAPGNRTVKQIIAANVDIAFVILSLDKDFSVERLRRFVYQLSVSKIQPVIVLNKSDKVHDLAEFTDQLVDFELPVITMSAILDIGVEELLSFIKPGQTAILLGSSGVGKSTLTNLLLGDELQRVQSTRALDDTGRHTTVHRELFMLPGGGLLIDTPGVRELQLWGDEGDLKDSFDDVAMLIRQCKYTTCTHQKEAGCAVQQSLANETLELKRYQAYLKLREELVSLKTRQIDRQRHERRRPRRDDQDSREQLSDSRRGN